MLPSFLDRSAPATGRPLRAAGAAALLVLAGLGPVAALAQDADPAAPASVDQDRGRPGRPNPVPPGGGAPRNPPANPPATPPNTSPATAPGSGPNQPIDPAAAAKDLADRNEQRRIQAAQQQGQNPLGAPGPSGLPQLNPGAVPAGQPGAVTAPPPAPAGEGVLINPQPVNQGALGRLEDGEGTITLNFPGESVDLVAFVDYVGKALKVNIFVDEGLSSQRVLFRAPLEIPTTRLLPLLAALIEDKGFALVRDPMGWYQIRQAAGVGLNVEPGPLATTRLIPTPLVRPSSLQQAVTASLGNSASNVRMTAIDELGVLIVTGTPRTAEQIEAFVDRLLVEQGNQKLHRFLLSNVASDFARSRILQLNGRLGGSSLPASAAGPGGAVLAGGSLSSLDQRLLTDHGNGLIFRGTADEALRVREFVALVDVVTPLITKRYAAGAVAGQIAAAGEKMGLGPVKSETSGSTSFTFGGTSRASLAGLAGASGAEVEPNGSGFSVDEEQGSIVYFGTEAQHARVAELVKTFTEQMQGARVEIKMYKLHNAKAESVADVLQQVVQESQLRTGTSPFIPGSRTRANRPGQTQTLPPVASGQPPRTVEGTDAGGGAAGTSLEGDAGGVALTASEREVSIVADPDRNQIVIKASARQQAELERIIKKLDQRQPQVYIECQIVSVTTSDDFTWTVETQINAGQFLFFTNFGLTSAGTSGGTIPGQPASNPRIVPTGNRGATAALIKSDYLPFVINTLQSKANARIESNPKLLVADNATGEVQSQRDEPYAETTQGTATTTTGQGGVASAGTTLSVTPRISEGGYINLEYNIELSSFDRSVAQAQGLQPPVQKDTYSSTAQVPTDSTIVVGGFTLSQADEAESGIPILKDIPLIGAAFKRYSEGRRRITIFVFLTPRILSDANFIDLRLISEGPMRQVKVEGDTPELQPVVIAISEFDLSRTRQVPKNLAPPARD